MAQAARLNLRMQKEVKLLLSDPPPGASFPFLSDGSDDLSSLHVQMEGPEGSVYAKGVFELTIRIPERYPFHPPIVNFATPIYHPNIDTGGRICLDILNLPPKGAWQPSLNISTVITSIGLLLSEPNPDDGLMCDASREYKYNRQAFDQKAKAMAEKYAKPLANGQNTSNHSMLSDFRISMEVGGSNTRKKKDVSDFVAAPAKPHRISQKLLLESSCSAGKMDKNREEGQNLPLHSENLMAAEASSKESECSVNYGPRWKNQYGTGRKLSLGSSAYIHKKHDHETGNKESKSSGSLCNGQATFAADWGLSPEQLDDHQADFDQHACETVSRTEAICPQNQGQLSERTPLESLDKCETGTYEKATITNTIGDLSTSKFSKNVAIRAQPDRLTVITGELLTPKNSVVGSGTDAPDLMVKKTHVSCKKLSLGLKGKLQRPATSDKENSFPVSVFSSGKKVGTGRQVSQGPLTSLQGSIDNSSQHVPADHTAKAARMNEQGRAEPAATESESAIVLDSEDSEEEDGRSARSTALLVRKRAAKRKAQSVQTL